MRRRRKGEPFAATRVPSGTDVDFGAVKQYVTEPVADSATYCYVRKIGLTATEVTDDGVTSLEVPDRFATVRTNPVTQATEYLGTVGSFYTPIQNEEHAELLNRLVDDSGAHFDTAGSLRGGRETFMTMKLPDTMLVGG